MPSATHETNPGGIDVFLNDGAGALRRAAIHVGAGALDARRGGLQRGYAPRRDYGQRKQHAGAFDQPPAAHERRDRHADTGARVLASVRGNA